MLTLTPRASEAVLELWRVGLSLGDVARSIGRSRPTISLQLSGARPLRPEVLDAIQDLAGDVIARRIARAVRRAARERSSNDGAA